MDSESLYCSPRVEYLKWAYFGAIIVWLIISFYICFKNTCHNGFGNKIILLLPILLFCLALYWIKELSCEVENEMFKTNYLNLSLLVVLPILIWMNKDYRGDKNSFVSIIIMAMILTFLSVIDVWVPMRYISLIKHIKSIFHAMSVTLLIYAFYSYYKNQTI